MNDRTILQLPFFDADAGPKEENLFQRFIGWASPGGSAGINGIHALRFDPSQPYFEYSNSFLPLAHSTMRSWFIKQEHLADRRIFSKARVGAEPAILMPDALISDGPFLHFAKAYINIITFYKGLRTHPKATVTALIYVESALRLLYGELVDPTKCSALVFQQAVSLLEGAKHLGGGKKYDIGKEMEVLSGMLQGGHHTKTFRFGNSGFRLLPGGRF